MAGATTALDLNAITPEMYLSVGVNPNRANFQRQLGDITSIPVTQEQRDRLGRIRMKRLRTIKILSYIVMATSIGAIIVGALTLSTTSEFPFTLGGALVAGVASILMAILALLMVREGQKTPTGDITTTCFTHYVRGHYCCTFIAGQALLSLLGIAGIWATVSCATRKPSDDYDTWSFNSCHPNSETLYILSVFSLMLIAALLIMTLVMCSTYCCQMRAFGVKSRYEMLLDLQTARMVEMQRQQQQPMVPMGPPGSYPQGHGYYQGYPQGQGYQPVPQGAPMPPQNFPPGFQGQGYPPGSEGQGYNHGYPQGQGYQQGGHGYQYGPQGQGHPSPNPSAPPQDYKGDSAPPPSYTDVMEKS